MIKVKYLSNFHRIMANRGRRKLKMTAEDHPVMLGLIHARIHRNHEVRALGLISHTALTYPGVDS